MRRKREIGGDAWRWRALALAASSTSTLRAHRECIRAIETKVATMREPRWVEAAMIDTHSMTQGSRTSSYTISCFTCHVVERWGDVGRCGEMREM